MLTESVARKTLLLAVNALVEKKLTPGKSGNLSVRFDDGMLITPSGVDYADLSVQDLVRVDALGAAHGDYAPSSEWHMHLAVYQTRADCGGIVHTHSNAATALACAHREIPAFHYMVAVAGGRKIPCCDYRTFGTQALSEAVVAKMVDYKACLMANHGLIASGSSVASALSLAEEIESLATQYLMVEQLGNAQLLSDEEMDRVLEKFKTYGRPQLSV